MTGLGFSVLKQCSGIDHKTCISLFSESRFEGNKYERVANLMLIIRFAVQCWRL